MPIDKPGIPRAYIYNLFLQPTIIAPLHPQKRGCAKGGQNNLSFVKQNTLQKYF